MRDIGQTLDSFIENVMADVDPALEEHLSEAASTDGFDKLRLSFIETLRASVSAFGGPVGVAREYRATYDAAPQGSAIRSAIINNLMKAIQDYGEDAELDDEESMEAIEVDLRKILREEMLDKLPDALRKDVEKHIG